MKGAILALRQLRVPAWQVAGIQALSPELDEANAAAAVEWARGLEDEATCAAALASLVLHVPEAQKGALVAEILAVEDDVARLEAAAPLTSILTTEQCDGLAYTACFGTETESGELVVPSNEPEWIWLRLRELSAGLSAERVVQIARAATASEYVGAAHEEPPIVLAIHAALAPLLSGDTRAVLVEAGFASISVGAVANALRRLRATDPLDLFRAWVAATDHDSSAQLDEVLARRHGTGEEGCRDSEARLAMATRLPSLPHTKESLERRVLALQHIGDHDAAAALFVSAFRRLTSEAAKRWNGVWSGVGPNERASVMVDWWSRGVDRSPGLRRQIIEALVATGRGTYADDVDRFLDVPEAFESPGELAALLSHLSSLGDRISGATLSKLARGIDDEDLGQHFARLFQASLNYTTEGVAFTVSLCARVPASAFCAAFEAACEHVASSPPTDGAHPRWPGMLALAGVLTGVSKEHRDAAGDTFWQRVAAAPSSAQKTFILDACRHFTKPEGVLLDGLRATFDALEPSPGLALELLRLVDEPFFSHLRRALARWRALSGSRAFFSSEPAYGDHEHDAAWITACLCAEGLSDAEIFAEMGNRAYVTADNCLDLVPGKLQPDLSRVLFAALRGEDSLFKKRDVLQESLRHLHEDGVRSVVAQLIRLIRSTRRAGANHEQPFEAIAKESSWSFGGWVDRFSERQRRILLRQLLRSERPWAAEFIAVLTNRLPDDVVGAESARVLPYLVAAGHRVGAIIEWATRNAGRPVEGVVRELEELGDPKVMVIAAAALSSRCDPERKHRWRQFAMSAFHALAQMETWLVDTVYAVSGADWDILGAYASREPAATLTQTRALPESRQPVVTPLGSLFEVASVSRASVLQEVTRAVSDDRLAPDVIAEILDTVVEVRGWWP